MPSCCGRSKTNPSVRCNRRVGHKGDCVLHPHKPDTRTKRGVALPDRAWREFAAAAKREGVPLATWVQRACWAYVGRERIVRVLP